MLPQEDPIERLSTRLGVFFPEIHKAQLAARDNQAAISNLLAEVRCSEATVVVYGSLARKEWTNQSDVDWTLLIDGRADPDHLRVAQDVSAKLETAHYNKPGPTGVFGNMTFSHDLFNHIGGSDDTNENTTRRILLLLESIALTQNDAYERVLQVIVRRYLKDDRGLLYGNQPHKIPRYLINDIVRYWRLIAVDFVDKQRGRAGRGWALRNAKLKFSRKLIFVSGLLTCFGCDLFCPPMARDALTGERRSPEPMVQHLLQMIRMTPLSLLAHTTNTLRIRPETATLLFSSYDGFLSILNDEEKRSHLSRIDPDKLSGDTIFREVSRLGRSFQDALTSIFFKEDDRLTELTILYGVF